MKIRIETLFDSSREWAVVLLPMVAFEKDGRHKELTIAWLFWGVTIGNI
jgi:hypothetical protein